MATTRIMPLHVGKGRTESRAISDIIDYVANPQKTDNGRLIAGFACDSRTVDAEFLLAKRQYIVATGRVRGADDVIAYHVRQSFRPGEITPEESNRLGVEFAKRFTKGNHAFVVCTHIDKSHIHNHIIWSSVSLEYDRKFRNFWGSTKAVRRLSDTICIDRRPDDVIMNVRFVYVSADHKGVIALGEPLGKFHAQTVGFFRRDFTGFE